MKVAVIGGGILGMNMALKLHELEAAVTLFTKSEKLGGKLRSMAKFRPSYSIGNKKAGAFLEEDLLPLAEKLESSVLIKNVEVLRVHKRFLNPDESIEGRSRLADLFRVVYKVDPTKMIESQKKENPDLYKNFDLELLKSLGEEMESFEDFDLVVDASGIMEKSLNLGPGGAPALNELGLSNSENFYYGWDSLKLSNKLPRGHLLIAGKGEPAALAVLELKEWINTPGHGLTLVSEADNPFSQLNGALKEELEVFLKEEEVAFSKKMEEYREKVFSWRELEDYEKAKIPMPSQPKPPFDIMVNSTITAVDRLLDKEGWFLTVESPEFKGQERMSTLKVDTILILKGFKKDPSLSQTLQTAYNFSNDRALNQDGIHPEAGYYSLESQDLETGLTKMEPIIKNMLGFFTKVED